MVVNGYSCPFSFFLSKAEKKNGKETRKKKEKSIFHLLVCFPDGLENQDLGQVKARSPGLSLPPLVFSPKIFWGEILQFLKIQVHVGHLVKCAQFFFTSLLSDFNVTNIIY